MKDKQKIIRLTQERERRLQMMAMAEGVSQNELVNRLIDAAWNSWGEGAAAVLFSSVNEPAPGS